MAVEIGSLVVRGTFGSAGSESKSPEEIAAELKRLRGDILEEVRDMIAEAERRRKGR